MDDDATTIGLRENNSGGFYHLGNSAYRSLTDAGWEVDQDRRKAVLRNSTLEDARESFRSATGHDPDECYCDCCGGNFDFTEDPYWLQAY